MQGREPSIQTPTPKQGQTPRPQRPNPSPSRSPEDGNPWGFCRIEWSRRWQFSRRLSGSIQEIRSCDAEFVRNYESTFNRRFLPESVAVLPQLGALGPSLCWGTSSWPPTHAFKGELLTIGYAQVWKHIFLWAKISRRVNTRWLLRR